MPKLINTHTRIAGLGKPRGAIIGGASDGPEVAKDLLTSWSQTVLPTTYSNSLLQAFHYSISCEALKLNMDERSTYGLKGTKTTGLLTPVHKAVCMNNG